MTWAAAIFSVVVVAGAVAWYHNETRGLRELITSAPAD